MAPAEPPITEGWDSTTDPSSGLVNLMNSFKFEAKILSHRTLHPSYRSDPPRGGGERLSQYELVVEDKRDWSGQLQQRMA